MENPSSNKAAPADHENASMNRPHEIIKASSLSKRFNREWIFRNLTYNFTKGSTVAITGPNGSGKSTLIQVLTGHIPPTSGILEYYNDGTHPIDINNAFKMISIAAPYMELIDEFTLEEQLRFHFSLKPVRDGITIDQLIDIMYLPAARKKHISNFSSGMKQRLKLGLAFYTKSDVIFLDEPGTNLDKQAFNWYLSEYRKVKNDALIIIASNDPAEYEESTYTLNISDYKK